jgi:hypothetical protein
LAATESFCSAAAGVLGVVAGAAVVVVAGAEVVVAGVELEELVLLEELPQPASARRPTARAARGSLGSERFVARPEVWDLMVKSPFLGGVTSQDTSHARNLPARLRPAGVNLHPEVYRPLGVGAPPAAHGHWRQ